MSAELERVWTVTAEGVRGGVRRRRSAPFIKGPIPLRWIQNANLSQSALCVGLYLWFKKGLGESPIKVSPGELRRHWGLRSRRSVYKALAVLEGAGLIGVDRAPGRCARVVFKTAPSEGANGHHGRERNGGHH